MVMCRPASQSQNQESAETPNSGGPVFVPRRKLSPLGETLLAELREGVTPYDDLWFAGRPVR